ncbi:MAG: superoxide dismutase, partial [Verrucomicrobiales bacterium]|nr:superoxide dismutase [Verrucomicrobiales bacterium]
MKPHPTRRDFILSATAAAAAATTLSVNAQAPATPAAPVAPTGPFSLPSLPYEKAALAPHIDALTMEIHHGKHHQAYVNALNTALKAETSLAKKSLEDLIGGIPFLPEALQTPVRNQGGGHWNHSFFWLSMAPPATPGIGGSPGDEALTAALVKAFGSIEDFKKKFNEAATKRFGSGWAWLILKEDGTTAVVSTPNQDNPLMQGIVPNSDRGIPLLGFDVWEHAYYLNYQNKRPDYITAWWNVVNWPTVAKRFADATASL